MTLYRIEHTSGTGMFRTEGKDGYSLLFEHSQYDAIVNRHNEEARFPTLYNDKTLLNLVSEVGVQKYRFAYLSLGMVSQALTHSEFIELTLLGFSLYAIEATDYYSSPYQAVFRPESVTKKEDLTKIIMEYSAAEIQGVMDLLNTQNVFEAITYLNHSKILHDKERIAPQTSIPLRRGPKKSSFSKLARIFKIQKSALRNMSGSISRI